MTNLFDIPVQKLWNVPLAEARRRLRLPERGAAAEFYREIALDPKMAAALREEWRSFGIQR
jgi:hypothetical protein